jgi:hypothetical protein
MMRPESKQREAENVTFGSDDVCGKISFPKH